MEIVQEVPKGCHRFPYPDRLTNGEQLLPPTDHLPDQLYRIAGYCPDDRGHAQKLPGYSQPGTHCPGAYQDRGAFFIPIQPPAALPARRSTTIPARKPAFPSMISAVLCPYPLFLTLVLLPAQSYPGVRYHRGGDQPVDYKELRSTCGALTALIS